MISGILSSVLPIMVTIGIGILCNKINLLSRNGTGEIKKFITSIALPAAVFHALATAEYNKNMMILFLCMMIVLFISFGAGFMLRPLLPEKYNRYLPFITSVYEGGMMAFPLYMNLFGEEHLSNIAIFDIATMLVCFSILITMLQSVDSKQNTVNLAVIIRNALRNPVFIGAILGIICGMSGIVKIILDGDAGAIYLLTKNMITAALNSFILIIVGYDFEFDKKRVKISFRSIIIRAVTQGLLLIPLEALISYIYPGNVYMYGALLLYLSAPPSFSMQSYIETEEPSKFIVTTNSLYMIVTLAVYIIAAAILNRV